jgi:hypothetical protein
VVAKQSDGQRSLARSSPINCAHIRVGDSAVFGSRLGIFKHLQLASPNEEDLTWTRRALCSESAWEPPAIGGYYGNKWAGAGAYGTITTIGDCHAQQ